MQDRRLYAEARSALDLVRQELIARQTEAGHWEGRLSSSSLSTATAISAMAAMIDQVCPDVRIRIRRLIVQGVSYLSNQQNTDGGFGDTDRSHSNIATSYLVWAASTLAGQVTDQRLSSPAEQKLDHYIESAGGIDGLRKRYGKDKTFVVPILTNLAIAGLLDWKHVVALPFEAAALPQSWYRLAKMPVVSYAIPALVAIGQAKHFHNPSRLWPLRFLRSSLVSPTLNVLDRMQPDSGGYLEATPLTSFVLMSLASSGRGNHAVCSRGLAFLEASVREDGSWPIDTNLATWVTSLSVAALSADPKDDRSWYRPALTDWLLNCQHQTRHPFTGADPGGWGWTNLSGAVPDGDDTPAAILALRCLRNHNPNPTTRQRIDDAILKGQSWLIGLQNRDGGMPTFCRGWGKLPFDRSSTDLTAHAIRAWSSKDDGDIGIQHANRQTRAAERARAFLICSQQPNGSWLPLWFGNQDRELEDNPVYGTAKVLLLRCQDHGPWQDARCRAANFLVSNQNSDGGWGGGPSVSLVYGDRVSGDFPGVTSSLEETALAVEALIKFQSNANPKQSASTGSNQAIIRGTEFLIQAARHRLFDVPWPIGFYFAKLWYYENLYPLIYTVSALSHFLAMFDTDEKQN
jgi:squalene-hopene/tetraprenyl-beta-curcumene cyclase